MAISDPQHEIVDVNPAFERITGFAAAEVVGRSAASLGLFVDLDDRDAVLRDVSRHGPVGDREVPIRIRNNFV